MARGPYLPNLEPIIAAGINPKTGLPVKMESGSCFLLDSIKKALRVKEEAEFVNRYVWYNLPANITSQELERMLYYKGQLCLFYDKTLEEFYFTPYSLNGTIDWYGRFNHIKPVPLAAGKDEKKSNAQDVFLSNRKLKVQYDVLMPDEIDDEAVFDSAVILRDYTNQLSQTNISRQILNDDILTVMAETIPLMRTRLILGTGVKGVRVNDADQARSVGDGATALEHAALTGKGYIPIVGSLEFQELSDNAAGKSEEYMLAYQSLDNFRKELMGIPANGVFEKKAHMLASEQAVNGANVDLVLQDGLSQRLAFCAIANSIWGLGIWCEIAESISNADLNGDGVVYDRSNAATTQSTSTTATDEGGEE